MVKIPFKQNKAKAEAEIARLSLAFALASAFV
jgi:hypothetical protein